MHFNNTIAAAALAFAFTSVLAAPIPQLAGEGAACDSAFSSTDNGVGYGVEDALDGLAGKVGGAKGGSRRRQLAGEGAACNSLFSSTDNGLGYGIENIEDGLAGDNTPASGGSGGGPPPPPPPPPGPHRRQLDKVAKGMQTLSQSLGTGSATETTTDELVTADGQLTSGAATLGADLGSAEETSLENAGTTIGEVGGGLLSAGKTGGSTGTPSLPNVSLPHLGGAAPAASPVPGLRKARRQLDKIANGFQTLAESKGLGSATSALTTAGDTLDGSLTSGAANAGAQVGSTEESTLEKLGSSL